MKARSLETFVVPESNLPSEGRLVSSLMAPTQPCNPSSCRAFGSFFWGGSAARLHPAFHHPFDRVRRHFFFQEHRREDCNRVVVPSLEQPSELCREKKDLV